MVLPERKELRGDKIGAVGPVFLLADADVQSALAQGLLEDQEES